MTGDRNGSFAQRALVSRRSLIGAGMALAVGSVPTRGQQPQMPVKQRSPEMRLRFTLNGQSILASLEDNPSARDLYSMAPMELTLDDFSNNEKIAYLPRPLTPDTAEPFQNERAGDLCYYAPWRNLALFYAGYRWSRGLIRLGRFETGFEPLLVRGTFPLLVEAV